MVGLLFDIFNKNRQNSHKITKIGPTTHFCYSFWVIRSWGPEFCILDYESTNAEECFAIFFFWNFNILGTPGYPKWLPLGVKTPKITFFGSIFLKSDSLYYNLKIDTKIVQCPMSIYYKKWLKYGFLKLRGTQGPQNFKPP